MTTTKPGVTAAPARELESQISLRRADLIARLVAIKTETRIELVAERDRIKAKLSEVAHIIKAGVVDGWPAVSAGVAGRLGDWLSESAEWMRPPAAAPAAPVTAAP
jgi:hypothetical protein